MNLGILSSNAFVKCFTLVVMMLFSYDGAAQDYTYNLGYGKPKIYAFSPKLYTNDAYHYFCVANIISSKDEGLTKDVIADKFTICYSDEFGSFSSSYGNFVEFLSYSFVKTDNGSLCVANPCIRDQDGNSIVQNGSNLYLIKTYISGYVDIKESEVKIITTELNNKGDDFQIMIKGGSIFILNNGVINVYFIRKLKEPSSSVSCPKVDVDESKTYSIDGMQVDKPHNGIFIKDNKKAFVK